MTEKLPQWEATKQDKELIGKLQVACSITTDPANRLSLTSSLITKVNAVMEAKCKANNVPKLEDLVGELLLAMLASLDNTQVAQEKKDIIIAQIDKMFEDETIRYNAYNAANCLRDMYLIKSCSNAWKDANKIYMTDKDAWAISNSQIHDIDMVIDSIIRRNDLSNIPTNMGFSTADLNLFGKSERKGV